MMQKKGGHEVKNKISTKIIMAIVSCSVLVSAIVGIANSMKSSSIIKAEANDTLLNLGSREEMNIIYKLLRWKIRLKNYQE